MSYGYRNSHLIVTGKCKMLLIFFRQDIALSRIVNPYTVRGIEQPHLLLNSSICDYSEQILKTYQKLGESEKKKKRSSRKVEKNSSYLVYIWSYLVISVESICSALHQE